MLDQRLHVEALEKMSFVRSFPQSLNNGLGILVHHIGNAAVLNPVGLAVIGSVEVIDDRADGRAPIGPNVPV